MNFDAILASVVDFFSDGIGTVVRDILEVVYSLLYPSNSDAATPVEIPM